MKEQAHITALSKNSANTPWRVSIGSNQNYFAITVGGNGGTATSPRFNLFLAEIEKRIKRYPVEITFYHLSDYCDVELTKINNKIVYIDCGLDLKRIVPKGKYAYEKYITGSPLCVLSSTQGEETTRSISGSIASTSMDYIAVGRITNLDDGDTISVLIEETSDLIKKHIDIKKEITIRFLGMDTPETRPKTGADPSEEIYKRGENTETAKLFKITVDDVYDIGEEAKVKMEELLNYKKGCISYCVLHFDRRADGRAPATDKYGRYLCEVYTASGSSAFGIYKKVKRGESFIHTNKTMLTTFSKTFTHVPLGIYSFEHSYGDSTVLNCFDWISELGIKTYTTGTNILGGCLSDDLLPDSEDDGDNGRYESTLNTMTLEFGQEIAPNSNKLDFFEPYDDRVNEFIKGIETVEDLEKHSKVRIGDCILTIPPTSISVNKTSNIKKVKTLRTKSSVMVNRGQSLTTLTMELYFHNLENVNGIKYPWKKEYAEGEEKKYFYVDGLRPLLAQFAKAPFLPICNYYINDMLDIQDVALLDLEVSTVPNYPESLVATITLMEFDSSCYTMSASSLYEAINFPMLRWYYNQALEAPKKNYKHRFFKGVSGNITNDISFSIANQAYLEHRKMAIDYIKKADSPEQVMYELKNNNSTYSSKKKDAKAAKNALKIYDIYKSLNIGEKDIIDYPSKVAVNGLNEILQDTFRVSEKDAEDIIAKGKEYYVDLYKDTTDGDYKKDLLKFNNIFVPYETDQYFEDRFNITTADFMAHPIVCSEWEKLPFDPSKKIYEGSKTLGYFKISVMEDAGNQALLESRYMNCYNEKKECFYLPATDKVISLLKEIRKGAEDMIFSVEDYEREYNAMLEILDGSEDDVQLENWEMEGTLIPVSVSASFSNEFATVPVQTASTPSLQYLGGGDAYLDIVVEADDDGARSINELVEQADHLARTYNIGITNGFVGIDNHLAGLFGIDRIMFESLTINTVPNYPGRYQIHIRAVSFDKTQRRREELTALSANSTHIDPETLKGNRNAFANDRMIEARLRTLDPYPDLELPTYEEINKALPLMDTNGCTEYKNLTNGVFLDPDFYFSTKSTFRSMVEDEYLGSHQLNMYDSTGIAAYTSSTDYERLFNMTEEDIEKMEELEKETESVGWLADKIAKMNEKENGAENSPSTSTGSTISQTSGKVEYANDEIRAFMEDVDENGKHAYENFPTFQEWQRLFPSGNHNKKGRWELMKDTPNGTEFQIYKKIDMLVDKHFKPYYSYPNFIKDCKGNMDDANKVQKNISYTPPAEFYTLAADYAYKNATTSVTNAVKKLINEDKVTVPDNKTDISNRNFKKAEGKITKERFMTIFKAFLDKASGWQQYNGKKPSIGAGRVGICQVDITGEDMTLDEVKRLMYNWRYNMEVAFQQLLTNYKKAATLKEGDKNFCKNFESYVRPWDTMFAFYSDPSGTFDTAKSVEENSIASGVMNGFNKYATKPFNTRSGYNSEVYVYACGLSEKEIEEIKGGNDSEKLIETLLSLHYYDLAHIKSEGLTVKSKYDKEIKPVMKEYLEGCSLQLLQQIYQSHLSKLSSLKVGMVISIGSDGTPVYAGDKDGNGYNYSGEILLRARNLYQGIKDMNQAALDSTEATDTRLYNDVDPQTIYQEMYYDLRYHDHRGRMLRAFPTFQMFIIHEGDYFGKYKFWDNMYGFNAIESIDVYRSRKIAADTAVISMTNIYGNLTTRRTDVDYADRHLKWWDNYVWNVIPDSLVDKKANEVHKNIYLEPGARIHLRMGYGGNAQELPIIFNGTITEMDTGDVIEIVAQGDGIELGNVVSGDPDDDNNGLFCVTEPRDLICKFMASKGSWLKDFFNNVTEGLLFEENPLGIMHFGNPWNSEENGGRLLGTIRWFNDDYGEVAQNIYSSNGTPSFSQWMHPNGEKASFFSSYTWSNLFKDGEINWKLFNPNDEDNVVVNFYNQTVWDIIQTVTYCSPDYIATVLPFELRSSLFFGKPYWRCAFQYGSTYHYNEVEKTWVRHLQSESRRPYMQHKFYTSEYDIIANNIKASEDTLFTNVIVNYDGHQTEVLYADADIRYDKHKTRVVEANICAEGIGPDFYTSEVMANYYGASVLRDAMKDMYKGDLLVLGDPTVKPYDMMYISDTVIDMQGNCLVKAVTHHFSMDTGYVTSIEPDLYVSNDDTVMQSLAEWSSSAMAGFAGQVIATAAGSRAVKGMYKWLIDSDKLPSKVGHWLTTKGIYHTAKLAGDDSDEMKSILKDLKDAIDAKDKNTANALRKKARDNLSNYIKRIENTEKLLDKIKAVSSKATLTGVKKALDNMVDAGKFAKGAKSALATARGASCLNIVGLVANIVCWIGSEMLFEKYRRRKENLQCVICMPLTYRGKEFVAGITNHAGMVYGDSPGRLKKLYNASLGVDDGEEIEGLFGNTIIEIFNHIAGTAGTYVDTSKEKQLNEMGGIDIPTLKE